MPELIQILPYNGPYQFNFTELLFHLQLYNIYSDFKDDVVQATILNSTIPYIITEVEGMLGVKSGPWKSLSLAKYKQRFLDQTIRFRLHVRRYPNGRAYDFDGAIEKMVTGRSSDTAKGWPDLDLYLTPVPFIPLTDDEEDFDLRIELLHPENAHLREDRYPACIDRHVLDRGTFKQVTRIDTMMCNCAYGNVHSVKPPACKHTLFLHFEDGSNTMYSDVPFETIVKKGYVPHLVPYRSSYSFVPEPTQCYSRCQLGPILGT